MSDDRELLECPFCGSDQVSHSMGEKGDGTPWPYVECEECAACAEPDMWNRRAPRLEAAAVPSRDDVVRQFDESVKVIRGIMEFIRLHAENPRGFDPELAERRVNDRLDKIASLARSAPVREVKPVAWMYTYKENDGRGVKFTEKQTEAPEGGWKHYIETPLYTTPPAPPEGWRPIETAPKDGTGFQGWSPETLWEPFCVWRDGEVLVFGPVGWGDEDYRKPDVPLTHWMPLPAAPQPGDKA